MMLMLTAHSVQCVTWSYVVCSCWIALKWNEWVVMVIYAHPGPASQDLLEDGCFAVICDAFGHHLKEVIPREVGKPEDLFRSHA